MIIVTSFSSFEQALEFPSWVARWPHGWLTKLKNLTSCATRDWGEPRAKTMTPMLLLSPSGRGREDLNQYDFSWLHVKPKIQPFLNWRKLIWKLKQWQLSGFCELISKYTYIYINMKKIRNCKTAVLQPVSFTIPWECSSFNTEVQRNHFLSGKPCHSTHSPGSRHLNIASAVHWLLRCLKATAETAVFIQ